MLLWVPFRLQLEPVVALRLSRWFSSQRHKALKKTHKMWVILVVGVAGFEPAQA